MSHPRGMVQNMAFTEIAPFARRQYGLVTHDQALTVITDRQLKRALLVGRLEPVRRGVYRVAGVPESWHQFVLAACLARPRACASFSTAAALWAFPGLIGRASRSQCPASTEPASTTCSCTRARCGATFTRRGARGSRSRPLRAHSATSVSCSVLGSSGASSTTHCGASSSRCVSSRARGVGSRRARPSPVYDDTTGAERARSRLSAGRQRSREAHRGTSRTRWPSAAKARTPSADREEVNPSRHRVRRRTIRLRVRLVRLPREPHRVRERSRTRP